MKRVKPLLGTFVSIQIDSPHYSRAELIEFSTAAFAAVQSIHEAMSFQCPRSELSRVNSSALRSWSSISMAMVEVLQTALEISAASDGWFDVSVGMAMQGVKPNEPSASWQDIELDASNQRIRFHQPLLMDLSGIAKGYAVDQAARCLPGELDYAINAGGDLRVSDWSRQSAHVRIPGDSALLEIPMSAAALASSSDEWGCQTVEPRTGKHLKRAALCYSVFAQNCMVADALTKVLRLHAKPHEVLGHFGAVGHIFGPSIAAKSNHPIKHLCHD